MVTGEERIRLGWGDLDYLDCAGRKGGGGVRDPGSLLPSSLPSIGSVPNP